MIDLDDLPKLIPHAKYQLCRSNGCQDIACKIVTLSLTCKQVKVKVTSHDATGRPFYPGTSCEI
jgi:hypothetical protein